MTDKVSGNLYDKLYEMRAPVKYDPEIDNDREDLLSDDEERTAIQDMKNNERAYRDDRDISAQALHKVIKTMHKVEKKVHVQSALSHQALNLKNKAIRQSELRSLMTEDFNSLGDQAVG